MSRRSPMPRVVLSSLILWLVTLTSLATAAAQAQPVDAEGHQWWQHAVFYEIYPRSFADSNNDGIGDLNGITSKMSYLQDLGVDAIWITPCFPSPQVDFGYDVSDYENIDPMYGTLADFDHMVAEGKKHHVRIILDFVVNHTSDQHPWFLDSKSSRTAAHRDWYIWRDGRAPGQPPNNWISIFGGSAWKFDPTTSQYYYHFFYAAQPDLNWRNPAVEKAMLDTTRWWYKRGVAGFRLDAVDTLFRGSESARQSSPSWDQQTGRSERRTNRYNTQSSRGARRTAEAAQSGRRIERRADRRNLDLQRRRTRQLLRPGRQRTADADGLHVHHGQQTFAARFPPPDRGGRWRPRLAGLRDQQSRHRPLL